MVVEQEVELISVSGVILAWYPELDAVNTSKTAFKLDRVVKQEVIEDLLLEYAFGSFN